MRTFLVLTLLLLGIINMASMFQMDLYEHAHHQGDKLSIEVGKWYGGYRRYYRKKNCHQLPRKWWDRVSSLNIRGNCVVLYSREDCTSNGSPIKFYGSDSSPDNIPHHNFMGTWFDDNARSYSPCH